MIPRNRPVINEADIARRAGVPLATWRRRDAPDFRSHVPGLLPDSRSLLYDLAQTEAYLAGKPVPSLPAGEHPDDLLTDKEAAAELGINPGTVRAYAAQGHLSGGTTVYGTRLWPRREVNERRDNPPGRGKGGGRRAGEHQGPRKAHPYDGDPRLQTATDALAAAASAPKSRIAAELAAQHEGTPRTWERLLTTAAALQDNIPHAQSNDGHETQA
ncbi:helix-turn-helix domain-containing protein [Streptomyces sp. NBC_01176]|uniref:helix-turn-helix domain-containing protein n=1 Tax=Streptomyces sp. NBC_01176 TaxID=2903760 RepID=UPI002F9161C4|nr:helix-turn-helix domain-containing protein [Streptomyces sp. NBC_01176]WSS90292.1 helix-turn-helix domain-containing protein [Streptomyces sp. NBC_01176]